MLLITEGSVPGFPYRLMKLPVTAALVGLLAASLPSISTTVAARSPFATVLMPIEEVKAGMVGVGRTVFEGTELKDFKFPQTKASAY